MNWPIGMNEDMDRHAAARGLSHWSCVDPTGNSRWLRMDGEYREIRDDYVVELRQFDARHPLPPVMYTVKVLNTDTRHPEVMGTLQLLVPHSHRVRLFSVACDDNGVPKEATVSFVPLEGDQS